MKKLVAFPVLGGMSNLSIISYIEEYLKSYGLEPALVHNEEGNKASLHCRIGPAVDGGIVLSGHTDVVPVEGQDWSTDPWLLTDGGDGKLYGRGSCDMKGFIACCLAVIPDMVQQELEKPIYLAFSYDEEIGCLGAPDLIDAINKDYQEQPTYAIIGEPSMMQPITGQKGMCIFKTTVNGSEGHSSRINQEVSAIHESARLILWLENKMKRLIADGNVDERFDPPHTSLHSGIIKGGLAPNVISDSLTFLWDVRTIPRDSLSDIRNDFNAYCAEIEMEARKKFPKFAITTEEYHPPVPPLDTPENLDIVRYIRKISGRYDLGAVSYAAEAGQFMEGGFQSVICGPGSIAQAHRANEFISKDQLRLGVEMIIDITRSCMAINT